MNRFTAPCLTLAASLYAMPAYADGTDPWRGVYIGGDLGVLSQDTSTGTGADRISIDDASALPGVHVGYNFGRWKTTASGGWLAGVELDVSVGDFGEAKSNAALGDVEREGNFIANARLRAGYAWDRVYVYGTAGLSVTDIRIQASGNDDQDILVGGIYGIGVEYRVNDRWSTRIEALGYAFDGQKQEFNGTERDTDLDLSTLRLGVSYRF